MSRRPPASTPLVSRVMKKVRVRDTGEELVVRRALYARGIRYRINFRPDSPRMGRASIDIAIPSVGLAIFIDGCFWHGCPEHGGVPKANRDWWRKKLEENRTRDLRVTELLESGGWTVLRFWSHETPDAVCGKVQGVLGTLRRVSPLGERGDAHG